MRVTVNTTEKPMPPLELANVGRFQILKRIAVGGMADIYLACERTTHGIERMVVIKRMLPHLSNDADFVEMFLQEARVTARINHPNVVQIYDLTDDGELPYIAMEYIDGVTLRELATAASRAQIDIPAAVAIHLVMQACAGAQALHELKQPSGSPYGLVHRDLSPHNLMVTAEGHIKLLDFGIAKATATMDKTRTGMLKGKVTYMSPEQCQEKDLDRRSDIYTLGIVLWELLSGARLFQRQNELASLHAIISGSMLDLYDFRPECPKALHRVVVRALSTDATHRFSTADEMRRALANAAKEAELSINQDETAQFIQRVMGQQFEDQRTMVEDAMEATTVSVVPYQAASTFFSQGGLPKT